MAAEDKRTFSRVDFEFEALLEQRDSIYEGHIANLSLRGMFFISDQPLSLEDPARITLQLTGHSSTLQVDLEGRILRKTEDGYAIEFQSMDIDSFMHLKSIISYNDGDPDKIEHEFREYVKNQLHRNRNEE